MDGHREEFWLAAQRSGQVRLVQRNQEKNRWFEKQMGPRRSYGWG